MNSVTPVGLTIYVSYTWYEKNQYEKFPFYILIPCIIYYEEINQLIALKIYNSLFSFTMAPTCLGKKMPSSGSKHVPF
jgi:uncharacterized membrane protein